MRYVSPNGSASNSGTSPDFPWADINTPVAPGTTIALLGGAHFADAQLNAQEGVIYTHYGAGPYPAVGAKNLKNQAWSNEGGNVWSCEVIRTGGIGATRTGSLNRNGTWFLNGDPGRKTALADLESPGDFYHPEGTRLYIYNVGNPASDVSLSVLRYSSRLYGANIVGVDNVTIDGIDFQGSYLAAIRGQDSHNIRVSNSTWHGHRECGFIGRITEDANGNPVREEGHYIFDQCNANWVGYRTDESSNIFFIGGGAGQHQPRLVEINGGTFGPICGTDCVTNNGSATFASGRKSVTIARSATFINTFGENPWDSKVGEVEQYDCVLIGNGSVESPKPVTVQLATQLFLARRCRYETFKLWSAGSFTRGQQSDTEGRLYDIQDCEFVKDYEGTAGSGDCVIIDGINDPGAQVIFKGNKVTGQIGENAGATCLKVLGNHSYMIQNNEFIKRGAGSHVELPSPANSITFSGNMTPDAGGLVVVGG